MQGVVDHLVIASADLDTGIAWVAERLGVAPVLGGVHDGAGTRNALLGLGDQYLEVLSLDPAQPGVSSPLSDQIRSHATPELVTVAVARSGLANGVPMSRVRPDGTRMAWELEFTATPLFFIDWLDCPRPSGFPDAGRITSLTITTPDPAALAGVPDVDVVDGDWHVAAAVNGTPLA